MQQKEMLISGKAGNKKKVEKETERGATWVRRKEGEILFLAPMISSRFILRLDGF
jgi:hypothetical protein